MKFVAMLLCVLLCFAVFAACGSDAKENSGENNSKEDKPTDEIFDVGDITVAVPKGWMAFRNTDIHAEVSGTLSKRSVTVCKGATSEFDIFSKPYVRVDYYGSDIQMIAPDKSFYDNVTDVAPFELGGLSWSGFSCESVGVPMSMIIAENGSDQYQVTVVKGQGDDAISLEDEEVIRIIESITVKETADNSQASDDSFDDTTVSK